MKLVSYLRDDKNRAAIFYDDKYYDLKNSGRELGIKLPGTMKKLLQQWDKYYPSAQLVQKAIEDGRVESHLSKVKLFSPVPEPPSCRDGYAFRQHVATARRNRGVEMIPEFDQYPVFYFTNHNAVFGEGELIVEEDHLQKLDFELEAAVVISRTGKNISSKIADEYIAGYMIMNDISARLLQMEEMKLNLGPAKGKDFATICGPWLVTVDELEEYKIKTEFGNKYNLSMKAYHNGKLISDGNMKDMNWSFAELIERASYGVQLKPGDIIGSGTVGTGCYLELNGTHTLEAKEKGLEFTPVWLQNGDTIELEIVGLGKLKNKIVKSPETNSILKKKKNI
ncbi:MAG: fumarylacetoacetate hydrolase family protein [Ignavibacteriaceae bacterium]|nr:fumarylacetoacetate hydrolase family protein [Ignavibacteriaceae bacterium]